MPGVVLMENAGRSCAELIIKRLSETDVSSVCIFCGTGNNGGDGYVIARHLSNCGINVRVVICGDRAKIKGDAKINLDIIEGMRVSVEVMDMAEEKIDGQVRKFSEGCDMFVDGLFGTGLKGEPYSEYLRLIRSINSSGIRVVAIDIPSGLDCDSGIPMGDAIKAAATITFVAVKKGFVVCAHSAKYTGDVFVASIGVEPASRKKA
jgi:NAD(P)H-hydrate epimerase